MLKNILAILFPVCLLLSGCAWRGYAGETEMRPYTNRIVFSPDQRQAAYVWTDRCWSLIPLYIATLAEAKTELLGWCTPDGVNHLVEIDRRVQIGGFGNSRWIHSIAFSPDGQHLAVVLADRVEIIDTATDRRQRLAGPAGEFTSAVWLDSNQLAYAMSNSLGDGPGAGVERSVYRQAIEGGQPIRVFARKSGPPGYDAYHESWSPDGRTVLLAEANELWRLDVTSGAVSLLTRAPTRGNPGTRPYQPTLDPVAGSNGGFGNEATWCIKWKPDGEEVSVLASDSASAKLLLAGVLECKTWRFTDRKQEFCRDVGDTWVLPISWTPDGFLLVRWQRRPRWPFGLIRYSPWKASELLKAYGKDLPVTSNGVEVVQPLAPGWLAVGPGEDPGWWPRVSPDQKDPMMYAVSYDGKQRIPITKNDVAASPEGRKLAEVVGKGKIVIKELNLPVN